mmetsp:Transcript_8301/g.23373  ORF Transcript_8301/g.23373 Transcript_8301/m.23373 type:complete len:209 (+) Transcript_8301:197-823(+)
MVLADDAVGVDVGRAVGVVDHDVELAVLDSLEDALRQSGRRVAVLLHCNLEGLHEAARHLLVRELLHDVGADDPGAQHVHLDVQGPPGHELLVRRLRDRHAGVLQHAVAAAAGDQARDGRGVHDHARRGVLLEELPFEGLQEPDHAVHQHVGAPAPVGLAPVQHVGGAVASIGAQEGDRNTRKAFLHRVGCREHGGAVAGVTMQSHDL